MKSEIVWALFRRIINSVWAEQSNNIFRHTPLYAPLKCTLMVDRIISYQDIHIIWKAEDEKTK